MSPLVGCPGPGGLISGGAFVRGVFVRGDFFPGGLLPGALLSGVLMPTSPKLNAYKHRLGFLCHRSVTDKQTNKKNN